MTSRAARRIETFVFLAVAQVFASLLARMIHEVVGHGLVAELLGGDFILFYVSPITGWAYSVEPEGSVEWVRAGGVLAGFLVGFPSLWWLRARGRETTRHVPLRVVLWFLVVSTVVGGLAYMSGEPLMRMLIRGDATGDWDRVYQGLGIPYLLPFLVFGAACVWFAARTMEEAQVLMASLPTRAGRRRDPLSAFWTLWTPGLVVMLGYAAAGTATMSGGEWRNVGTGIAGMMVITLAARAWLRIEESIGRRPDAATPASGEAPGLYRVSIAMLFPVVLTPIVFGPFEAVQRGVVVGGIEADRYDLVAQSLEISGEALGGGRIALGFRSLPLHDTGSPLRRTLTEELSGTGPSTQAVLTLTRFVSSWNMDGAEVVEVSDVRRDGDRWAWDAVIAPPSDRVMIRLWPLTMFAESHIQTFDLVGVTGARSFTSRGIVADSGTTVVWRRGTGFEGIDSLAAGIP